MLTNSRQFGGVSQDIEPPKFSSILRKGTKVLRPLHTVHFSNNTLRHKKIRESKGLSFGVIHVPVLMSAIRTLQNLRIGLRKRQKGKSDAPAETR